MGFLKNMGSRLLYFIIGVILTVLGALLVYFEFKSNWGHSSVNSHYSSYPFIMLVIGIAAIAISFSKNINTVEKEKGTTAPPSPAQTNSSENSAV
jgi:ABC-type transport system involved in multi-copper enzyme maturation permease subunit